MSPDDDKAAAQQEKNSARREKKPNRCWRFLRRHRLAISAVVVFLGLAPGLVDLSEKFARFLKKSPPNHPATLQANHPVSLQGAHFFEGIDGNRYVAIDFENSRPFSPGQLGFAVGVLLKAGKAGTASAMLPFGPYRHTFSVRANNTLILEDMPFTNEELSAIAKDEATLLVLAAAIYRHDENIITTPMYGFRWNSDLGVFISQ